MYYRNTNIYLRLFFIVLLCTAIVGCSNKAQESSRIYHAEAYFSPAGGISQRIIKAIYNSNLTIDIAIFDFTSQDIKVSLEKAKIRGVSIRIIADSRQAKGAHSVIPVLINKGFNIKITHGKSRGIMHNKFAIFDNALVFTGSYNWTANAELFNYENAVFIFDANTIKGYRDEFDKIWKTAK